MESVLGEAKYPFSAKGAVSHQPGASPQEFKSSCKISAESALHSRGRVELMLEVSRAFSAGAFVWCHDPGALPQARDEYAAPLALNHYGQGAGVRVRQGAQELWRAR